MADQIPLRIVTVSGQPFIGEFQSGDTVGVVHGGTGASSIAGLKTALDYNLTGLDDVAVGFPDALSANQIIVWNGTAWVNEYNDKTEMRVRNGTASAMSRGDVIAIEDAHNANLVNVILADASQTSAMPALGVLEQDLAVGEEGIAITFGKAQGLNTSGLTEGATAYVSPTTPGGITTTKPTSGDHFIQNIGIVMRANASNGAIKVTGIGRANDIPNATITTASGDADYVYVDDGGVWKKITPANLGVGSGGGGGGGGGGVDESADYDFSSTEFHVFSGNVNVNWSGTNGPTGSNRRGKLNVRQDDTDKPAITLYAGDDGADAGPILEMNRDSASPANNDYIGQLKWTANSDSGTNRVYAKITGKIDDVTNGSEDGLIEFMTRQDGSNLIMARFKDNTFRTLNGVEIWSDGDIEINTSSVSGTMDDVKNHIASGSVHFTEASIDHGSIAGLADDDHTQYVLVDGSRNINTQNLSDTYTGTVGDTSLGFGIETTGNLVNKAGNYLMFSSTNGYQFRKDGLTAYTSTDLPDTMRNWDSAYNQLNTSFYPSFIQLKESGGGQNINQATKQYVEFDTVDNSGGAASTDFTHNGSDTITINTAGTYEITINLAVSAQGTGTTNQRTCQNIRIEKDGTDIGPMLATGYIRITTSHETASYTMAPYTMTLAATDVLKVGSTRENSQTGGVGTMGEMCFWTIRRIL